LQEQIMKFRTYVEPPEPMKGLEIPAAVVQALGAGKRPAVRITINRHSWKSRVAIMRGRYLLGLSNANRQAAGVVTGDEVEVDVEIDAEPRVVVEPADFARALDADPIARAAYERLSHSRKREQVLAINSAKKTETRLRRIERTLAALRHTDLARGGAPGAKTRAAPPPRRGS
jgi:antitoxin component of MazEF toxin-antitoxin module